MKKTEIDEGNKMLWNLAIILALLWAIGLVTSYTLGGFIHVLVVAAIVLVMIRIVQNAARARGNGKPRRHKRRTP